MKRTARILRRIADRLHPAGALREITVTIETPTGTRTPTALYWTRESRF